MKVFLCIILISLSVITYGQTTSGTVSFTVTTIDNNKHFSPAHVLAIWVENGSGNFVKTLKVQAARRKQYLYNWKTKSGGNMIDAISGPTLSDHQSHTVIWNCMDTTGKVVKDGDYQIVTEFTSEHAQGPVQRVVFTKGPGKIKLNPEKQPYFIDMNLVYTPGNTSGNTNAADQNYELDVRHPAGKKIMSMAIIVPTVQQVEIGLFNQQGKLIANLYSGKCTSGKNVIDYNLASARKVLKGNYVIIAKSNLFIATRNVVI